MNELKVNLFNHRKRQDIRPALRNKIGEYKMKSATLRTLLFILLTMSLCITISCNSEEAGDLTDDSGTSDSSGTGGDNNGDDTDSDPLGTGAIIIDHTSTDLSFVPLDWIEEAKDILHIAYGHTSHGSQITTGMTGLVSFANAPNGGSTYEWNNGGTNGALDLRDSPFSGASDLGNPDRTAWADATRDYLDSHSDINVIIWSWCGQADGTEEDIDLYHGFYE